MLYGNFCGVDRGSLTSPIVDRGFSLCFYETVSSVVLFSFLTICGLIEYNVYKRYASRIHRNYLRKNCFYTIQVILIIVTMFIIILRLFVQDSYYDGARISPSQIVYTCLYALVWPMSLMLIRVERHMLLPTVPTRGHGLVLLAFWFIAFAIESLSLLSLKSTMWWFQLASVSDKFEMGFWICRISFMFTIFVLGIWAPGLPTVFTRRSMLSSDPEQQMLINQSSEEEGSTWQGLWRKSKIIWPFVWPKKNIFLQFCVFLCAAVLVAGRVVNLFIPIYYKKIVDSLTIQRDSLKIGLDGACLSLGPLEFRWDLILVYVGLKFLQGSGVGTAGLLNSIRSLTWIWVQQYTSREVSVHFYQHLHSLSLRWHLTRKTGEVLRVMDRGTSSINTLFSYVAFQIVPTLVDIVVAFVFFLNTFNAWFALILFITVSLYIGATIAVTEWRTKFRRTMNLLDNERNTKGVDSLLNFETVKYYGAEDFEVSRYKEAIIDYQKAEWISNASLVLLNTLQNVIIISGFASGAMLCAWYVSSDHGMTVGDFVLFCTYILQLYAPLNFFGTYYRAIQQSFIDMENMFELFDQKQEITDADDAPDLLVKSGLIEFKDVAFSYDGVRPILQEVSFRVAPGETLALVGMSGGGKSTIIRLLFRFYDVVGGQILIDGQDIAKVKQKSLRQAIGVVPQDTVLFNSDIKYNIAYGRIGASEEEIEDAARAAEIHERILNFPDGYESKVGERGLKLSGGEKQRIAIARTVLKSPQFVLLDEATSALDTHTERNIQASLAKVCEGRTTIIVAHRLSTIIHADQILVLKEGAVVESGTHKALLESDGEYASMWMEQLQSANSEETPAVQNS